MDSGLAIGDVTRKNFFELLKVDHLVFKFEVYKVLFGVSSKTINDFASHTGCRLGKWYYEGEGKKKFSHLPGYASIEPPHADVHKFGREALSYFFAHDIENCAEMLKNMEAASLNVMERLAAVEKQANTEK
ncbi:MAG: CZB domain-containing protein [Holophagales bacterium]|nr:CZB domain-containing protein [Holophagales bacterium]